METYPIISTCTVVLVHRCCNYIWSLFDCCLVAWFSILTLYEHIISIFMVLCGVATNRPSEDTTDCQSWRNRRLSLFPFTGYRLRSLWCLLNALCNPVFIIHLCIHLFSFCSMQLRWSVSCNVWFLYWELMHSFLKGCPAPLLLL